MKPNQQQFNERIYPFMPGVSRPTTAPKQNHITVDFVPFADEVARTVRLNYGNQASLPEDELQHWLEAEAQLLREHKEQMTEKARHSKGRKLAEVLSK
jgi:NADPH-dependent ferric siderophore reductase